MARKEKVYHFIYKTTNLLNGKYYFGMHSTDNLDDGYLGSGKRLKYSINKYGKENHKREILEYLPNSKELANREKEIVNLNEIAKENCLNLMAGGIGGFISETQQKYRSSCAGKAYAEKLKNNIEFRNRLTIVRSNYTKKNWEMGVFDNRVNCGFSGKKHTSETKKKIGEKNKNNSRGDKNSQYGKCWVTNGIDNKLMKKCDIIDLIDSKWKLGRIMKK